LNLENPDQVGASDRVAARALALVGACRALDSTALARECCLLADEMGYGAFAATAAQRLPADDPVRLFVSQQDARLVQLASSTRAGKEARFLYLTRLARACDTKRWAEWLDRYFGNDAALALPISGSALALGRFETHMPAAAAVLLVVAHQLRLLDSGSTPDAAVAPERPLRQLMNDFEDMMRSMKPRADGVFLDRELLRGYFRGCFYSALGAMGEHYRNSLSSVPATRDFAQEIANNDSGPAGEFAGWYGHLAAAKSGHLDAAIMCKDLSQLPHFGAPLRLATFEAIHEGSSVGDPLRRTAAVVLSKQLDTRPGHRTQYGWILHDDLWALDRAEDMLASAARSGSPMDPRLQARWAGYLGDRDRLQAMLEPPDLTWMQQVIILGYFEEAPAVDSTAVCGAYQRCIARHPDEPTLAESYAGYLVDHKDYPAARVAIQRWLDRKVKTEGLEDVLVHVRLARTYFMEGRYQEGLDTIEPFVASQQFGAMALAALLLDKLGRGGAAESLAVFAWTRYPDNPPAQALVAELLWKHGKPELAARALATSPYPMTQDSWAEELAPWFRECYQGRPRDALRAVDAMVAARLPAQAVRELARQYDHTGDSRMAFDIVSRVRSQGQERLQVLASAYHYLKRGRGEGRADAWLRGQTRGASDTEREILDYVAFSIGEFGPLWCCHPKLDAENGEFTWVLRAAAALRSQEISPQRREELRKHCARTSDDHYRLLGRYLLGLEKEPAALASAIDGRSTCEAYYYVGLKAQAEGRYRDAAHWYWRCIATNQTSNGEYHWAYEQLYRWMAQEKSLDRLAHEERGALTVPGATAAGVAPDGQ